MKHYIKPTFVLAGALLAASSFLNAGASAPTPVATDPVGYVSQTFDAGTHLVSAPLFSSIAAQGAAGTVAGADVDVSGLPTLATPHFLLVTSGTAAGEFSSVLSTDGDTATLESAIQGLALGDTVKVIEHFTLGDLHTASGDTIPDNTTITVYNADGSKDDYIAAANSWYNLDGFALSDNVVVFPGEGFVASFTGQTTLTFTGLVNVDAINVPLTAGAVNIIGSVNPSAPVGSGSIGAALASLPDNSTITIYTGDGALSKVGDYILASGGWYNLDGFALTDISEAAPSALVVSPNTTQGATLPAAYTE